MGIQYISSIGEMPEIQKKSHKNKHSRRSVDGVTRFEAKVMEVKTHRIRLEFWET